MSKNEHVLKINYCLFMTKPIRIILVHFQTTVLPNTKTFHSFVSDDAN